MSQKANVYDIFQRLSAEKQHKIAMAITEYLFADIPLCSEDETIQVIFSFIQPMLRPVRSGRGGSRIGAGRKSKESKDCLNSNKEQINTLPPTPPITDNYNPDIYNNIINNNITTDCIKAQVSKESKKSNDCLISVKKNSHTTTKFIPPTIEQVAEYCKERNNNVDPEHFVAFYEAKGWQIGKNPMRNWRAAIVTWEKRNNTQQHNTNDDFHL